MPVAEVLEAATVAEEVSSAAEETAVSVDLTTVSQQLDQIVTWQMSQFCGICVLIGVILGVAVSLVIGRLWK